MWFCINKEYIFRYMKSGIGTGEFEKHAGCWMGWPDSGNLWRENAKPAQEQYANTAKAISEFEPLTMFANKGSVNVASSFADIPLVSLFNISIFLLLIMLHATAAALAVFSVLSSLAAIC